MSLRPTDPKPFRHGRAPETPAPEPDPADLGTAFGLDLSFDNEHRPSDAPNWLERLGLLPPR